MLARMLGVPVSSGHLPENHLEVDHRYRLLESVAVGAEVSTCVAEVRDTGERVQVHKMTRVLADLQRAKRTLRELRLLRHMHHENVIELRDLFFYHDPISYSSVYVVAESGDMSLAHVLEYYETLASEHHLFFLYQLLRGMKYVHSANVAHGDLRPQNLMINTNCDLKISGFGRACVAQGEEDPGPDPVPCKCRWYQAPEMLSRGGAPSFAGDLWAIGCIQPELHRGKPLFRGLSSQQHLALVSELLGPPAYRELQDVPAGAYEHARYADVCPGFSLPELQLCTPQERDLVSKLLRWDPQSRISLAEALRHPFLEDLHMPDDEPERGPLDVAEIAMENDPRALVSEFFREALRYHPELHRLYEIQVQEQSWLRLAGRLRASCSAASRAVDGRKLGHARELQEGEGERLFLATLVSTLLGGR